MKKSNWRILRFDFLNTKKLSPSSSFRLKWVLVHFLDEIFSQHDVFSPCRTVRKTLFQFVSRLVKLNLSVRQDQLDSKPNEKKTSFVSFSDSIRLVTTLDLNFWLFYSVKFLQWGQWNLLIRVSWRKTTDLNRLNDFRCRKMKAVDENYSIRFLFFFLPSSCQIRSGQETFVECSYCSWRRSFE